MTIIWSPEAIDDLGKLRAYIAQDDPQSARRIALHILGTVERHLPENPQMGRSGRVPGTRELIIPQTPFVVPYRLVSGAVQILRVYHGARPWPERF